MKYESDIELIEKYLQGDLTVAEVIAIESRLKNDKEFAGRYRQEAAIYKALKDQEALDFLNVVSETVNSGSKSAGAKILSLGKLMWSLAAVFCVLTVAYIAIRDDQSNQELFEQYYETYPLITIERGESDEVLKKLNQHYADKAWNEVLTDLSTVREGAMMDTPLTDLYEGISYLNLDQPDQAIAVLEKYKSSPANPMMQETLLWYLSLAYMAADRGVEAKETLKTLGELLSPDSARAEEVKALLDEIK